jgi:hypothetical protein
LRLQTHTDDRVHPGAPLRPRRRFSVLVLAASAIWLTSTGSSQAQTYAQGAIASLNAQRATNGLPAGIVEVPDWSAGCEKHMSYLRQNGEMGHGENPYKPGYSPEGAAAGGQSVLAFAGDWPQNPWEDAPIHLAQVLHPALSHTGAARGCMHTWPGHQRPAPPTTEIFTYPGPGRSDVPMSQSTAEIPYTPAELLGLANPTGPHLYVFPFGGEAQKVATAQVIGAEGSVDVRVADRETTDGQRWIGSLIPQSTAIIIPVKPLRPLAAYSAAVHFVSGLSHTWTFRTGQDPEILRKAAVAPRFIRFLEVLKRDGYIRVRALLQNQPQSEHESRLRAGARRRAAGVLQQHEVTITVRQRGRRHVTKHTTNYSGRLSVEVPLPSNSAPFKVTLAAGKLRRTVTPSR